MHVRHTLISIQWWFRFHFILFSSESDFLSWNKNRDYNQQNTEEKKNYEEQDREREKSGTNGLRAQH